MIEMDIHRMSQMEYQAVEAVNTLCANLSFVGGDIKKIMVTSCQPQEGKTFISMNLLKSMANLGMRVALVDADIRASALQGSYGIEVRKPVGMKYMGLSGYLAGRCAIKDIVAKTDIAGAYIVLAGRTVGNSLPLISSPRLGELLIALAEQFDLVIVDAPPVGAIIDAAKIAALCDGTVFVVQSGRIAADELREATAQIERAGCPVMGYVLNKFDVKRFGGREYDYGFYYYAGKERLKTAKQGRPAEMKQRIRNKRAPQREHERL